MVATAMLALSPLAREIFHAAFVSKDRWLQDLFQLIYIVGVVIAAALIVIEWGVRVMILRRRARALAMAPTT